MIPVYFTLLLLLNLTLKQHTSTVWSTNVDVGTLKLHKTRIQQQDVSAVAVLF